ncbi:MAG: porin family protein [Prevotella sp.]|nr:porin family protein [Prevotella sp.]
MKKIIISLVAIVAMYATPSMAQLNFGVKGGLNVTNMSIDHSTLEKSNHAGFFIGPTAKFKLPLIGLGFDAAVLYDQRDAKVNRESITQKSINVPINLRYTLGLGDLAGVYFAAGPQFGFNMGNKIFDIKSTTENLSLKKSNFSINLGAGVRLIKHIEIGVLYNIACGKTGELNPINTTADVLLGSSDIKTNAWQISAAYYF